MPKAKAKRIIALGDLHCGHVGGLTPPGWQKSAEVFPKFHAIEAESWKKYKQLVRDHKDFDGDLIVICNGDAIDGDRNLSELITGDLEDQIRMARKCLQIWDADKYCFVSGTPFHTGGETSRERELAEYMGGTIVPKGQFTANGLNFQFRHKVGRGSLPYTRGTAPSREKMFNKLAASDGDEKLADIMCFSHVHYFLATQDCDGLTMTLPALQTISEYGSMQCSGRVDWGLVIFDVAPDGSYTWEPHLSKIKSARMEVQEL